MTEQVSFIKALQTYFSADGGRKLTIPEMKSLTFQDKLDLHAELAKVGVVAAPPLDGTRAAA